MKMEEATYLRPQLRLHQPNRLLPAVTFLQLLLDNRLLLHELILPLLHDQPLAFRVELVDLRLRVHVLRSELREDPRPIRVARALDQHSVSSAVSI